MRHSLTVRLTRVLAWACALAAGCATLGEDPTPRHLSATLGGMFVPIHVVTLQSGVVTCKTILPGKSPSVVSARPTPQRWTAFRTSLDSAGVWNWSATYPNDKLQDGIAWGLTVEYSDRRVESGGVNSYPDQAGAPSPTPEPPASFLALRGAVSALVAGCSF